MKSLGLSINTVAKMVLLFFFEANEFIDEFTDDCVIFHHQLGVVEDVEFSVIS